MPGFPEMSWPMIQWVLDNYYPNLKDTAPQDEQIIYVLNGRESDLLSVMTKIDKDYPLLRLSSLPHLGKNPHIEFSLRGDTAQIAQAMSLLKTAINKNNLSWSNHLDKK